MHVMICFAGICEPNPGGLGCFGFSVRGHADPRTVIAGAGIVPPIADGLPMSRTYAEWVALGKAIACLVKNIKLPPDATIVIIGTAKHIIEQLTGNGRREYPDLVTLRDACLEKLKTLGRPWTAEWIPPAQNVEADLLARAAYVGRTNKVLS